MMYLRRYRKTRAQSTLEYATLIMVVVGALVLMSKSINRAQQDKFRKTADSLGEQVDIQNMSGGYHLSTSSHTDERALPTETRRDTTSNSDKTNIHEDF